MWAIINFRTEGDAAEFALENLEKVFIRRSRETSGKSTGLDLIHSGYGDIVSDDIEVSTTSCPEKSQKVSRKTTCESDFDADGFKIPLPPKRNRNFALNLT